MHVKQEKEIRKRIFELVKQQRVIMTRIGTRKLHHLIKPSLEKRVLSAVEINWVPSLNTRGCSLKRKRTT
jgi:hypothetical protein